MVFGDGLRKLRDLQRRVEQMDGQHSVPFTELFHDEFMLRNTEFASVNAMFGASGFKIESSDDFAAIPEDEWDTFIRERTRFASWEEMKSAAVRQWVTRNLGLG